MEKCAVCRQCETPCPFNGPYSGYRAAPGDDEQYKREAERVRQQRYWVKRG